MENAVDRLCGTCGESRAMWREKRAFGERKGGEEESGREIHRAIDNVEKEGGCFRQTVEKGGAVCYNENMQEKTPDFAGLAREMARNGEQFEKFYAMLTENNAAFNLTAITEREEVIHKHFLDSLAGAAYLPAGGRIAEVGSGAGFPSVPLAIVRRDVSFTLIESTGKKCAFLRKVSEALGLNLTVVQMRAEEAGRDAAYREQFDAVIARAVAPLVPLCEYCLPLVKQGGRLIAWKGSEDETPGAVHAVKVLGGGNLRTVAYELPNGYGARRLVLADKVSHTPEKYPRGHGKERKDPIV